MGGSIGAWPHSAAPKTARYKSGMTQNAYMLNTTIDDMYAHQAACQLLGGHLVSYTSLQEQQEVEELFVSQGVLLPAYHLRYWLGLYIPYRDPKLWPGG